MPQRQAVPGVRSPKGVPMFAHPRAAPPMHNTHKGTAYGRATATSPCTVVQYRKMLCSTSVLFQHSATVHHSIIPQGESTVLYNETQTQGLVLQGLTSTYSTLPPAVSIFSRAALVIRPTSSSLFPSGCPLPSASLASCHRF